MSQNSSKNTRKLPWRTWILVAALPAWVFVSLFVAQLLLSGLVALLEVAGVSTASVNNSVFTAGFAAVLYTLTLLIAIGVPYIVKKRRVTLQELGLQRWLSWSDIGMAPVGLVVYFVLTSILAFLATMFLPGFDIAEPQDTGFGEFSMRYEYIIAFVTLVIVAPIAEEVLVRGYLFGKLRKYVPLWAAVLVTSLLFGFVHGAWNVAIDTFALSVVLCILRVTTGSLWAPILLHMIKNGIAFYLLFINPLILNTLGG